MSAASRIHGWLLGVVICVAIGLCAGCGKWSTTGKQSWQLPHAKMSPDSVVLEVAIVRLPVEQGEVSTAFWSNVDEQLIPTEVRQRLERNGLRCGVLTGQLPEELQRLTAGTDSVARLAENDSPQASGELFGQQRLQNRTGSRSKIVTSEIRDQRIVLTPEQGRLTGQTFFHAQCLFSVKTFPQGDGQVRLELVPEIEHGQPKQRWVGQTHEGTFRLDTSAERAIFDHLRFEPKLAPGQSLIVSCTPHVKGLGRQFFADASASGGEQRLLLIRLAQTQVDDLFAPENISEPLITPAD